MPCAPLKLILISPGCLIKTLYLQISINETAAQRNVCALKIQLFQDSRWSLLLKVGDGVKFLYALLFWWYYFDKIARSWKFKVEADENRKVPIGVAWCEESAHIISVLRPQRVCILFIYVCRISNLRGSQNSVSPLFVQFRLVNFSFFSQHQINIVSGFQIIIWRKHWHKYYYLHRFYGRLLILFFASLTRTHYYADQNLIWREAPRWFYSLSISKAHYQST